MKKKRWDGLSSGNKKAQITIFIIAGVVLFLVFIFLVKMVATATQNRLEVEREKVISKDFQKEALRIYMTNCLHDALVRGIKLLGEQGRIWQGQGGTEIFVPRHNGIIYGDYNLSYAIVRNDYVEENKYPCPTYDTSPAPDFCQFTFPNTTMIYGKKNFWLPDQDLKNHLVSRTYHCAHDFLKSDLSEAAELVEEDLQLNLKMVDDGIRVEINYPLLLKMGGEEVYALEKFDFFYLTPLKEFLEVALLRPIDWDRTFLDFNFSNDTLVEDSFLFASEYSFRECERANGYSLCPRKIFADKYKEFGIRFKKIELEGDDIFELRPTMVMGEGLDNFVFRIARENRPPALNFINDCPEGIITAQALDPDEEEVTFTFLANDRELEVNRQGRFDLNTLSLSPPYTLTVNASDGYLEDWQEITVGSGPVCGES